MRDDEGPKRAKPVFGPRGICMSNLLDRIGNYLRSEVGSLVDSDEAELGQAPDVDLTAQTVTPRRTSMPFAKTRLSPKMAFKYLGIPEESSLELVRERYQERVHTVHPRSMKGSEEQRQTAQTTLDNLTDALEVLERELLPMPVNEEDDSDLHR